MPLNRLPDVLLSNQTLTGVSADYLDGITSSTLSQSLRANRNITGGGTITFDASGNLFWSSRFIVISNGRGSHFSVDGYYEINCPTSGTITGVGGASNRSATGAGIPMAGWDALYVILPIGGGNFIGNFRVAQFTAELEVPHDWLLIAVRNADDGLLYLNNGVILAPGESQSGGVKSFLRVGTSNTENYIAFRGTTGDEPGGFNHTFIGERIYGGSESSELLLFKGNDYGVSGPDRVRLFANNLVFDTFASPNVVSGTFATVGSSAFAVTRMIITQNGNVGIGTATPDTVGGSSLPAMLGIVSNTTGTVGLVVKTIASQTASLQQWQNSAGTILAQFSAGGDFAMSSGTRAFFGGSSSNAYLNVSTLGNPVRQGIIVSGGTSQTGNLQEWQDSAGTVISRINPDGHLIASSRSMFGGATSIVSGMIIAAVSQEAAATPILARGSASQTADLQQWQNSSGTVLSRINSSGFLSTPRINFTGGTSTVSALALSDGTLSFESTSGQLFSISNSLTGTIFSVNDVSGLPIIEATDLGIIKINELYGQTVFGSATPTASALTTFVARTTSTIPVVVKGITSQSANLQNWYAGDGTLGTRIGPYGELVGHNQLANGIGGTISLVMWSVISGAASYIPIVVRGAASQTANLQEWQGSGGNIMTRIDAYGALYLGDTAMIGPIGNWLTDRFAPGGLTIINRGGAAALPFGVRGTGSQTANLTEWQNSSGTVLSKVDSTGQITSTNGTQYGTIGPAGFQSGGSSGIVDIHYNGGNTTIRSSSAYNSNASLLVGTGYSGGIGVIIKGVASQTADLQQWQNSSGTVLAEITASGSLELNGKDIELMNIMGAF